MGFSVSPSVIRLPLLPANLLFVILMTSEKIRTVWTKVSCCFAVFAKVSRSSMDNRWFTDSLLFPRSYPNTVLSITFLSGISSSGDKLSPWEEVYIPGIRLVIPFLIQSDIRFLIVFGCSIHLHSPSYPGMWHFVECFPRDYPNQTMICGSSYSSLWWCRLTVGPLFLYLPFYSPFAQLVTSLLTKKNK